MMVKSDIIKQTEGIFGKVLNNTNVNNNANEILLDNTLFIEQEQLNISQIVSNMKYLTEDFYNENNASNLMNNKFVKMEKKIIDPILVDYKMCTNCNQQGVINETGLLCKNCGFEKPIFIESNDIFSETIINNYNTSSNSYINFTIIGANSYSYNRSFLKTCSDYSIYRNNNNKKEIFNRIYQFGENHPPTNVINATVELFDIIKKKDYLYRGSIKWGVISACLYYMSIEHNVAKTPKEIVKVMQITDKDFGVGEKILLELKELGIIDIKTDYSPINDYLNQFFPRLEIDSKYKKFIINIITRMQKKNCHVGNESRLSTKIIGCIYLLTVHVPELRHITKESISEECNNITKSTYMRYYDLIIKNHRLVKKCFKYNMIPQPKAWGKI
jgi:transcription initiation factor TFIIIB Brf1 subunit/transcription initiation factor TFIIB